MTISSSLSLNPLPFDLVFSKKHPPNVPFQPTKASRLPSFGRDLGLHLWYSLPHTFQGASTGGLMVGNLLGNSSVIPPFTPKMQRSFGLEVSKGFFFSPCEQIDGIIRKLKGTISIGNTSSNHQFSVDMLVFGECISVRTRQFTFCLFFFNVQGVTCFLLLGLS